MSDTTKREILTKHTAFTQAYSKFIQATTSSLESQHYRRVALWKMERPEQVSVKTPREKPQRANSTKPASIAARALVTSTNPTQAKTWDDHVMDAADQLHNNHQWQVTVDGHTVQMSIGLVRVANIKHCIRLCRAFAAKERKNVLVVSYHAQLIKLQRWHIERNLDELLKRGGPEDKWKQHITNHPAVKPLIDAHIQSGNTSGLSLIVVATPVEEVGRDHDFDWAVIEPSSVQSMIQCAGRVNRHRRRQVIDINVYILQYNNRAFHTQTNTVSGKSPPAFRWPGLETGESHANIHDLEQLIDWDQLQYIDARLRFNPLHNFAKYDEQAIAKELATCWNRMSDSGNSNYMWMCHTTYHLTPLRELGEKKTDIRLKLDESDTDWSYEFRCRTEHGDKWLVQNNLVSTTKGGKLRQFTWLTPKLHDLMDQVAQTTSLDPTHYLDVQVRVPDGYTIWHDYLYGFIAKQKPSG